MDTPSRSKISTFSYHSSALKEANQLAYGLKKDVFLLTLPIFVFNILIFILVLGALYKLALIINGQNIQNNLNVLYRVILLILIMNFINFILKSSLSFYAIRKAIGQPIDVRFCVNESINLIGNLFILWLFSLLPYAIWIFIGAGILHFFVSYGSFDNLNIIAAFLPFISVLMLLLWWFLQYISFSTLLFAVPQIMLCNNTLFNAWKSSALMSIKFIAIIFYSRLSFFATPIVLMLRAIIFRDIFMPKTKIS